MFSQIGHYLAYFGVRLALAVIQALPVEFCDRAARRMAGWFARLGVRQDVLAENLGIAFPEYSDAQRADLGRRMWEHMLLMIVEVAHAPRKVHETNWRDYVSLRQLRESTRVMLNHRPAVFVSGHQGNFEYGGYITGLIGVPMYTVARKLDNPYLDAWLNRYRAANGTTIIPKQGGYEQVAEVMASGGKLLLLGDQYAGSKACWVDFFGRPASTHKAIALICLQHQAQMVVYTNCRMGRVMSLEAGPEGIFDPLNPIEGLDDVKRLTQWYSHRLEQAVRRAPEQYWWLHRRWKDRRPPRRRAAQTGREDQLAA